MSIIFDDVVMDVVWRADTNPPGSSDLVALLGDHKAVVKSGHTSGDGKVHAILGASSADRWMKCPGSVRMSQGMPNRSSPFAQEGTAAHHLCELSLASDVVPHWFIGQYLTTAGVLSDDEPDEVDPENLCFEITEEMADAVLMYTEYIESEFQRLTAAHPGQEVIRFLEKSFDLSRLYPDMFGTNDYSLFVKGESLTVVDYKHGRGYVVEARNNPQLLYYALGAILEICKSEADVPKTVKVVIVQPRAAHRDGPIREWEYTFEEVVAFSRDLVAAALATTDPCAKLVPGKHCTFCNGKQRPCPAVYDLAQALAMQDFTDVGDEDLMVPTTAKGNTLTISDAGTALAKAMTEKTLSSKEQLLAVLKMAPVIDMWVRDCQAYAQHEYENGRPISDEYKLVRRRSNRKHRSEEESIQACREAGASEAEIFKPAKIKTPAQLEKIAGIGKTLVAKLTEQPLGQLTLVPASDSRQAVIMNPFGDLSEEEMGGAPQIIDAEFTVVDPQDDWDIL